MNGEFRLWPRAASTAAEHVDRLYTFLLVVSGFFALLIAALVVVFAIRYRRKDAAFIPRPVHGFIPLEIVWSVIPLLLTMAMFSWGAWLYVDQARPPAGAQQVYVLGKQWMWKVEHPGGRQEINRLHVPLGRPVELVMISEDVIHSFFIPAFRVKQDVLPGRYTRMWFQATETGRFHLFCAEYCGTKHSQMTGEIVVLTPGEYQSWLAGDANDPRPEALPQTGAALLESHQCNACHGPASRRGPPLEGRFGSTVQLASGGSVPFDETYIRQSILEPRKHVAAGYAGVMPTYKDRLSEADIVAIIDCLKQRSRASSVAQR